MSEQASTEPRFTFAEAMRELALRQCATSGHNWQIVTAGDCEPLKIICDRCGWSGSVDMGDRPTKIEVAG